MTDDSWYFAYGSNMNPARKRERTGSVRQPRRVRLVGYRFAFNKLGRDDTGKANIIPDEGGLVWGVAYRCSAEAMVALDRCEGVHVGQYERRFVEVLPDEGAQLAAIAYVALPERVQSGLRPTETYVQHILRGAQQHGLPDEYVEALRNLIRGT